MAKKLLTWYLAFVMALLALAPRVDAFFAPTSPLSAAQVSGDERTDRARIAEFLEGRRSGPGFRRSALPGRR